MKKITRIFGFLLLMVSQVNYSQLSRVQIIHNCADAAASTVDVYLNGTLFLNDFAFRTATPFIDAPSDIPLTIQVAPGNSSSNAQSIYTITTTLSNGETYILVANGIVSDSGYTPVQPFEISIFAMGRETANTPDNVDIIINHGSTDAPTVDVVETSIPAGTIVDNISYPSFTDNYLELIPGNYIINVTDSAGDNVVASYLAPLQTLGLQGQALTVLASGFLDPTQNNNGPEFGLWVALAAGGELIPLPQAPTARVQVIHNCADLAASMVDVYLNGSLLVDDFAFRTATPFVSIPAGIPLSIDVAPGNSTSVSQSIYNIEPTLAAGETYILVANGIVSSSGYTPTQPFELSVFGQGKEEASNAANTDILVNHGSTDAPAVDIVETSVPAGTIVNDISFPSFSSGYLELPTADYILNVTDASGAIVVASYEAPLASLSLQGKSLTVLASGFLDPTQNSNGPAFGLWAALSSGGNLIPLPLTPLAIQNFENEKILVYPNPAADVIEIEIPFNYSVALLSLNDLNGRTVLRSSEVINKIDVSEISSGIYVLNLQIDNTYYTQKLIIK